MSNLHAGTQVDGELMHGSKTHVRAMMNMMNTWFDFYFGINAVADN